MNVTEEFRAARNQLLEMRLDNARAQREFEWPQFTEFNFALDWIDAIAQDPATGNKPALVIVEQDGTSIRRTFKDLSKRSNQVANWLRGQGVQRGDHMVIMLGNQVELWELMLACIKLGVVMIPTTTMMGPADLRDRVERGAASWVGAREVDMAKFADVPGSYTLVGIGLEGGAANTGAHAKDAAARPVLNYAGSEAEREDFMPDRPTRADDTMLLYFTSGTTSRAKLVEHTHTSYPVGHLSTMFWIGLEPGDVHLNVASPGWAKHAWSNVFTPWIAEACVFVYNYTRFDAAALMAQMDAEHVTSFCAPPTVWRMLIQADLTLLKTPPTKVVSAGEPLNAEVIGQVERAWGQLIRDGFGQTETTVQVANTPGQPIKIGSMGRPLPGYDVVLVDLLTGEVTDDGELCLRLDPAPVGLTKGYFGDPEKTADAFRGGYYHTGDVASRDENGILTYVGRSDDVFKSSDYRLSPFELESVLIEHPAVAEAAVVPSPDALRLNVAKAYIVLAGAYQPSDELAGEIFAYCREHLPAYKRIRRLEFSELPKTISGKIRRVELRANEEVLHGSGSSEGPASGRDGTTNKEYKDSDFPS